MWLLLAPWRARSKRANHAKHPALMPGLLVREGVAEHVTHRLERGKLARKARDNRRRMWEDEETIYARCTRERGKDEEPVYAALHTRLSTPR